MDLGSIFLTLAILIPVVVFIAWPLIERKGTAVTEEEQDYFALLAERERLINALQELEFDRDLGKIPENAFTAQRAVLMRQGAEILRQIDEYEGDTTQPDANDRLEASIQTRRAAVAHPDDDIEALIAHRRRAQKENGQPKTGGFCPQCGNCIQESDQFCPKCGHALN